MPLMNHEELENHEAHEEIQLVFVIFETFVNFVVFTCPFRELNLMKAGGPERQLTRRRNLAP